MKHITLLSLLLVAFAASEALGSGACPCRPPRPRKAAAASSANEMDNALYAAGKQVFLGQAALSGKAGSVKKQSPRLAAVATSVPKAKDATRVNGLAGRISDQQLTALEYYVSQRYAQ